MYCGIVLLVAIFQYYVLFQKDRLNVADAMPAWISPNLLSACRRTYGRYHGSKPTTTRCISDMGWRVDAAGGCVDSGADDVFDIHPKTDVQPATFSTN